MLGKPSMAVTRKGRNTPVRLGDQNQVRNMVREDREKVKSTRTIYTGLLWYPHVFFFFLGSNLVTDRNNPRGSSSNYRRELGTLSTIIVRQKDLCRIS